MTDDYEDDIQPAAAKTKNVGGRPRRDRSSDRQRRSVRETVKVTEEAKKSDVEKLGIDQTEIFRPSALAKMIEAEAERLGKQVRDVDPAKFLRERGLPNPLRRFRVVAQKGQWVSDPVEVDAECEPVAFSKALDHLQIGKPHQYRLLATILEE